MFTAKFLLSFALVLALAGRALAAFNITFGGQNLTVAQIIPGPSGIVGAECPSKCNNATSVMTACNDNANCLCGNDALKALTSCESCLFDELIRTNKPQPDNRTGSIILLGAYRTACNATTGKMPPATDLTFGVPSFWDGPYVSVLPAGLAALYTIFGAFFGISAIVILCSM